MGIKSSGRQRERSVHGETELILSSAFTGHSAEWPMGWASRDALLSPCSGLDEAPPPPTSSRLELRDPRPTCRVGRGCGWCGQRVFCRELQVRRESSSIEYQGLRRQLDVTPEHPQGRLGRDRIEAHVHQLGEQGGGGSAEGPPHRVDAAPTAAPHAGPGESNPGGEGAGGEV